MKTKKIVLYVVGLVLIVYGLISLVPTVVEHPGILWGLPVGIAGFYVYFPMFDPFTGKVYDYPLWISVPGVAFGIGIIFIIIGWGFIKR